MKILIILSAMFFVTVNISFAQLRGQARIDSLLKELPKMKEDTNGVNLFLAISSEYSSSNPDDGLKYGEQGLKLAEKIKSKTSIAKVYNILGVNWSYIPNSHAKTLDFYNKALKIFQDLGDKAGESGILNNIGLVYEEQSNYPVAIEYFHKSLKINTETENLKMMIYNLQNIGDIYHMQSKYSDAENYYNQALDAIKNEELIIEKAITLKRLAFVYSDQGDFSKAIDHHYEALQIFESEGDTINFAGELHNIANSYIAQANYPKALDYLQQALKINEKIGNFSWKANNLVGLAIVYSEISEHSKALEYNRQALKLFEEMDNKFAIAAILHNIGVNYAAFSDHEKAKEYYLRAMKMNEEMGNLQWLSNNLAALGSVYKHFADYSKALEYYERALSISEEIGDKSGIAGRLGVIGYYYLSLAQDSIINKSENNMQLLINKDINLTNSIKYLQRAVSLQLETGERNHLSNSLFHLSNAFELKGDYKNAFEAFKEHKTLQDSIFSMDKQKEFANLDAKRENELKDAEIIILNTEKKAQKFQSYLLGGGVIVLLGAFGVAFVRFREKKKLSDKLAIQNNEIESQKSLLEEKSEEIYASIRYASTIQHAILPWEATLGKAFSDFMIFYKPKDIVSGDSYWFKEVDGVKFLAVIDCTGHGIPGSMLTVIASSVLDDAVLGKRLKNTGEILTYMNDKVTEVLNQRLKENEVRDGMEVALIAINATKVQFSGAGRPLYMKNDTFEILKTDRRGIAGRAEDDNYIYTSLEIERSNNLLLYLTTDGFADQMNEDGKKFSTRRFLALLESIADKPLSEQYKILNNELAAHQGDKPQIDDVTILGVKI